MMDFDMCLVTDEPLPEIVKNWIKQSGVRAPHEEDGWIGVIAEGGDLSPESLIHAYRCGVFPWDVNPVIQWHAPMERMLLFTSELHVGATMRRVLARSTLEITFDRAFKSVVQNCAVTSVNYSREFGTWIDETVIEAYTKLHELGYAHSCEAWRDGKLVGGIYGISLGGAFFAESMFNSEDDAGKVAFVHLVRTLNEWGIELFDCQMYSPWTFRFGAGLWPRSNFHSFLEEALEMQTRLGPWEIGSEQQALELEG